MSSETKKASAIALLPLIIFVAVFLWSGIQYGSFYEFPAPIAVLVGIIVLDRIVKTAVAGSMDVGGSIPVLGDFFLRMIRVSS